MTRVSGVFFILLISVLISYGKPLVVTTVKPLSDIVRSVGGDKVDVRYLIPPDVSLHFYEYKSSDIKAVFKADLFLYIGSGEPNIKGILRNVRGEAVKVSRIKGIYTIDHFEFGEDHDHHSEIHPALWLHPMNGIKIAEFVYKKLSQIDSKNKEYYRKNFERFKRAIETLYTEWKDRFKDLKKRYFISYHYTWPYFTQAFDLVYLDVIELGHGREPTPKHLLGVIKKIKKYRIKSIFAAKQFYNSKYGRLIKDQTGVNIILLDPFGSGKDYIQMLRYNIQNVYRSLR
ncbi:MAG TPA: zinc ABC transporter substrate-binding protein [Persephonella sp.]|uniref:Periplasmic solute binding protein family n=1 Tax=Persephonella marina (strain DSM 14350 / EX-H1) TaxID=123214 RepID=C0QPY0_PERMH|nr:MULTISPECIES: metal ABC transporter substrate-binding protein [Persephonella]ACO03020.1 periplasmic solute binding protein family [Persephonella marina EX-H1]HCB69659.1 zinc ABC transporter substrate-binding protein [Persephonella sp.]